MPPMPKVSLCNDAIANAYNKIIIINSIEWLQMGSWRWEVSNVKDRIQIKF